jgi:antitoxin (DNA-binding transcriptional repressor) of toxin-antitoxin stability system
MAILNPMAVEEDESAVVTANGKPVAALAPPPPKRRKVRFGSMEDRIQLQLGMGRSGGPRPLL